MQCCSTATASCSTCWATCLMSKIDNCSKFDEWQVAKVHTVPGVQTGIGIISLKKKVQVLSQDWSTGCCVTHWLFWGFSAKKRSWRQPGECQLVVFFRKLLFDRFWTKSSLRYPEQTEGAKLHNNPILYPRRPLISPVEPVQAAAIAPRHWTDRPVLHIPLPGNNTAVVFTEDTGDIENQ